MNNYLYLEILCSDIPMDSGVYCIENLITKKVYIGSSTNMNNRMRYHIYALLHNEHHNYRLQEGFNEATINDFLFYYLEITSKEYAEVREQKYFDIFLAAQEYIESNGIDKRFYELGYNISPTAGCNYGYKMTPEQVAANSLVHKLLWQDIEWAENRRCNAKILRATKEYKEKFAASYRKTERYEKVRKPLLMYDRFTGNFIEEFDSIRGAARDLQIKRSLIMDVVSGKRKYTHDKIFILKTGSIYPLTVSPRLGKHTDKDKFDEVMKENGKKRRVPILCYIDDKFVREYGGINIASSDLKISSEAIGHVLNGKISDKKGYTFKYKDPNYIPKKKPRKSKLAIPI